MMRPTPFFPPLTLPRLFRPRAPVAWPRSRARPQKRKVTPLNPFMMFLNENLLWQLTRFERPERDLAPLLADIRAAEAGCSALDEAELLAHLRDMRLPAARLLDPAGAGLAGAVLALMRLQLGFGLRDNQIICALSLLGGRCVELRTGEGKTYAAGLAALLAAKVGVSSHVITVNDYLASRDHEDIAPFASALGLTSAVVSQEMSDSEREAAYDCDIVYGANKTFVFDHLRDLRDRQTGKATPNRQTGQILAIIDEADSVLVDDATTPMLLSEPAGEVPPEDLALFEALTAFADLCRPGHEVRADPFGNHRMTPAGLRLLERAASAMRHPVARSYDLTDLAEKALAARFSFREGEAWLRKDDGIAMIDQSTGRLMPDRKWDYGMQQLVEIRAGVPPGPENRTVGQMTQQSFFRQYSTLGGLTGTAKECRPELWAIYQLAVTPIAPHAPSRLSDHGLQICADARTKWQSISARARSLSAAGRAVLIGLNDVAEAETLAGYFAGSGLDVAVLDAQSEAEEAALVALAGSPGRITIATHLAGRGTDISPDKSVIATGGLHVIIGSAMVSARLVRQLCGRAGRKGQPGSYEQIISLSDRMFHEGERTLIRAFWTRLLRIPRLAPFALSRIQANRDARARAARRQSLMREQNLIQQLGYR